MYAGWIDAGEWECEGLETAVEQRQRLLLSLEFWDYLLHSCQN